MQKKRVRDVLFLPIFMRAKTSRLIAVDSQTAILGANDNLRLADARQKNRMTGYARKN